MIIGKFPFLSQHKAQAAAKSLERRFLKKFKATCQKFGEAELKNKNSSKIHCKLVKHRALQYNLTNRFHFAMRLYSDNAQMTSKRGENKEVRYEPQASSVTDVLTTF